MEKWTKAAVIARAKEVGARHRGTLNVEQLTKEGDVPYAAVLRLFPKGGFIRLRREAGLVRPRDPRVISDETLMQEFHRVAQLVGGVPTIRQVSARTGRSPITLRRLGGRGEVRERYEKWLRTRGLPIPAAGTWRRTALGKGKMAWRGGHGFGPPLDVRGIRHAPVNELGVVALFGALAEELGYLIEAVRVRFPDCEAKRLVDEKTGRWEKCRIEFEYRSSGFRAHRHDPKGCDVVVCWEHDWADCPVEVVELRREVERIKRGAGEARNARKVSHGAALGVEHGFGGEVPVGGAGGGRRGGGGARGGAAVAG